MFISNLNRHNIQVLNENQIVPVYKILGCSPKDVSKYSTQYILYKMREYYTKHK